MPLDPNIALGVRAPQLADPLAQYSNMLAVQNAQRQGQIGDLQYQNALRANRENEELNAAYQGAIGPDGSINRNALLGRVAQGSSARKIPELLSAFAKMDKEKQELVKTNLEINEKKLDRYSGLMLGLARNPTPDAISSALDTIKKEGLDLHRPTPTVLNQDALKDWIMSGVAMSKGKLAELKSILPEIKAIGGDMLNVNALSDNFLGNYGKVTPTVGEAETIRHNTVMEPIARTRANAAQGQVAATREATSANRQIGYANQIRDEQTAALKPLEDTQQKLSIAKQLLATSSPASDVQLQSMLADLFDKSRTTNLLFQANRNFGTLAGRAAGFLGRAFTGQYTDQQRKEIAGMINDMEKNVIEPSRSRVGSHYRNLSTAVGVNPAMTNTPNFYQDQDDGWKIERQ